jgi:drug/metabolite transporter (DMT)-like permease
VPLPIVALSLNIVMLSAGLIMSSTLIIWRPNETLIRAYPYLLGEWSSIGRSEWLILGLLAIFTVVIGLGIAGAYQSAPPSLIATFEYSYLVFVVMWDFFFFEISISHSTIPGMLLIIGAGLMVLRRR